MCQTLALLASVDVAIHNRLSAGGAWEIAYAAMLSQPLAGSCVGARVVRGLQEVSEAVAKPPQLHMRPPARPAGTDAQVHPHEGQLPVLLTPSW